MQSTGQGSKKIVKCALLFALLLATGATAHAKISVNPSPMNFGSQTVGVASPSMAVALTNNTLSNIKIVAVSLAPIQFSYSGASLPITLRPGQSLLAAVTFTPTAAQAYPGTLTFTRANGKTVTGDLYGRGIQKTVQSPHVTTQPASQTIMAGQTATFTVTATGTAPLSYQWNLNGTAISGATSSTYTTPAETTSASGAQFTVVISNTGGNVTSSAAVLTVNPAPVTPSITTQPSSRTITAGQTATFAVTATGTAPLSYQWRQNGTAISGATSSTYTTPAETTSASGTQFIVLVSNSAGSATSNVATLTVNPAPVAPSITTQPSSRTITAGQTATFTVTATGTAPLSYQWRQNGTAISGATSSTYTTPAETTSANGAQFTVVVSNTVGNATSSAAVLTVNPAPVAPSITTQPSSQTITPGQTATFAVTATGTAPLSYQWSLNGTAISGATSSTYTTPAETTSASGAQFTVVITNVAGTVTSNIATLTVNVPPSITTQPSSVTITAGQTATFSVTATGTAPLSYQWSLNGTAISGATSSTYTTPAETTSASGAQFTVVITNIAGTVTSNIATLTVNVPPSITTQPSSVTITAGQTATFAVTATGTAPLSYQWRQNGTAISGATSSTYTTPAETTSANGAQFTVVVSNTAGNATSSAAILTVNAVPPGRLVAGASALSFGNVNTGSSSSLGVTFTNSGSSNITISSVTISGPGFTASGVSAGLMVTSGQIVTLNVTFAPAATGSVTGSVSVVSNASNSPASIALTGTGVAPISHSGTLNWTASTSTVIGYDVYRGTVSGGPYTKINSAVDATTTFTDTTVQAGQTYYWVVTAVNSSNVQSTYSNEVSGTIPTP